jgi:addiction module RelE/StbE family toxin
MTEKTAQYIVHVTANAKNDLRNIIAFIAQNNPQTALKILERIESRINTLDHFPNRGGYVPELLKRNITEYRQLIESPWRIIYRVDENIVNVLVIIDSRRNVQDVLIQRLMHITTA